MREYAALIVIGSWLAFAPVMVARAAHLFGQTTRRRTRSMVGIALVTIGFMFAWPPRIAGVLAIASASFGIWAIYTLGRQWSIQARLRTDHRLVTRGPYRWVRHPVYACFFGLLVATGLVFSTAPGLAIAAFFYARALPSGYALRTLSCESSSGKSSTNTLAGRQRSFHFAFFGE